MSSLCAVTTGLMDSPKISHIPARQHRHQLKSSVGGGLTWAEQFVTDGKNVGLLSSHFKEQMQSSQ